MAINFTNKQILLLTSTNLTCNPRCLKEVKLLVDLGAKVTVVAFNLHNWSDSHEAAINKDLPTVQFHYLESTRKDLIPWLMASLMEKSARRLFQLFPNNIFFTAMAVSKRSWYLLRWCKRSKLKPDLIIAHNPAAFYPAYSFAMQRTIPFAIDLEDYHPGESIKSSIKSAVTSLMAKLLPLAGYVSYASPLIMEFSKKIAADIGKSDMVINNFFAAKDFDDASTIPEGKIKLVWFSQNIDFGRGLEEILEVVALFSQSIELTLIGNPKEKFCKQYLQNKDGIKIIPSMHLSALHKAMANYDVGLAIEPGKDINNTIALSNKILTYFQAGLYILASDTPAQKKFLEAHPNHGIATSLSKYELSNTIKALLQSKNQIRSERDKRFKNAAVYNWENESKPLVAKWQEMIA